MSGESMPLSFAPDSRMTNACAVVINKTIAIYAEDGLQWELMPAPMPGPGGAVQIGAVFAMWMPTPVLDDSKFFVSNMLGDLSLFLVESNVRQICHDYVEMLRKMKADYLRGKD